MGDMKIYGTLGPKCSSRSVLEKMISEGMTGVRLNLSHVSLAESGEWLDNWNTASGRKLDLLIDMQGPEMRIGKLSRKVSFQKGETIRVPVKPQVMPYAKKNRNVLLDDGKVRGAITFVDKNKNEIKVCVENAGSLTSQKSIKIEGVENTLPAITEHDKKNLLLAKESGVTGVMQPFVRSGDDIRAVKDELTRIGAGDIEVFAKIENRRGIEMLDDILIEADWVVIARGDLGNDIPLWELPNAQRRIAAACKRYHVPFIVVTQMMTSMEHSPVPTRAEISDVDHAVIDGASGIMVTGETAVGDYPDRVIFYLKNTVDACEIK